MHLTAKWDWAGRVANYSHERLAKRITFWRDADWWSSQDQGSKAYDTRPMKSRPGNRMRWEDALRRYCAQLGITSWRTLASHEQDWKKQLPNFCNWAWR
eukprot:11245546-Karenia_brevis.AAC.1